MNWENPSCLVVEDNDMWFRLIEEAIGSHFPQVRKPIARAKSIPGYVGLQKAGTFEVVILDVRLAKGEKEGLKADQVPRGGLEICPRVPVWNTEAVVVLFSAYVKMDDAVEAMRAGAWDCINKNEAAEPVERLMDAIASGLESRGGGSDWFRENLDALQRNYSGEHIAVMVEGGEVIAHGKGLETVRDDARKRRPMAAVKFFLVPSGRR